MLPFRSHRQKNNAVSGGASTEASQYLARATGMDGLHRTAFKTLIDGLVTDGIWTKLDALYVMATDTQAHALLNVKSASFPLVANGSPAFVADRGFTGVAASSTVYLDTQFSPDSAGGIYTQNSAHISAWSNNNPAASDNIIMGARGLDFTYIRVREAIDEYEISINGGPNALAAANTTSQGHYILNRSASNAFQFYKDGVALGSDVDASTGLVTGNIYILAYHNNGAPALGAANQVSAATIGGSLSGTEMTALYNRLGAYRRSVGL
jgi:hypothetical protein